MPIVTEPTPGTGLLVETGDGVLYTRQELLYWLPIYKKIDDVMAGEEAIKEGRERYLPMPGGKSDRSLENLDRYDSYIGRAVFYPVASRTAEGLSGFVFARDPEIDVPDNMQDVVTDADGAGIDLQQLSKIALDHVLRKGRGGLLVDYPQTDGQVTVADLKTGNIRPTLVLFQPEMIRNWRTVVKGAKTVLSLVVLRELHTFIDDGFQEKVGVQFRVLRIGDDGFYSVEFWRGDTYDSTDYKLQPTETQFPTDATGTRLVDIPFTFLGSRDNSANVDRSPMLDIVNLNIGHYRNSADYEEAVFVTGQPTPVVSGITEQWYDSVMNKKVGFGSRGGIVLPAGGDAKLLQVEPNTMAMEAMKHKEEQMIALGAKLIEPNTSTKTATEATIDDTSETSILSSCAKNVEAGFLWALQWAAKFVGVDETAVDFEINTNFDLSTMDFNTRLALLKEWQAGGISFTEYRENLRRSGIATQTDEDAKAEIQTDEDAQLQQQKTQMQSGLIPNTINPSIDPNNPVTPQNQPPQKTSKKAAK